ncbi:MAG TPA: hypothetical protein VFW19_17715 [Allosphingosinicella sp.]|nr:hypothetical protein [Allosphingosinicella sp.]
MSAIEDDIEFLGSVSRSRPAAGDDVGMRVAAAILRVVQQGWNGNHSRYPTAGLKLHRGRIATGGAPFGHVKDLWYPPAAFVGTGRAQLSGEPLFYCGAGSATAILELRPRQGDVICVMECEVAKDPLITKMIMGETLYDQLDISEEAKRFERFIATEFRRVPTGPRDYLVSGGIGSLFFKFTPLDAILYGSMGSALKGANFALRPEIADQYVKPLGFRAYEVVRAGAPADYVVRCLHAGTAGDGDRLDWRPVTACPGHEVIRAFDRPTIVPQPPRGDQGRAISD